MILDIVIFVAVLAVLVLVHEFGHFLSARKFKMLVEEFGFGFPPKIFSKKIKDTIWSINMIPLGGFVKIAGEDGGESKNDDKILIKETDVKENIIIDGEIVGEKEKVVIDAYKISSDHSGFFSSKPIWQRIIVLISGVLMNFILGWFLLSLVFMFGAGKHLIITDVAKNSPAENVGIKSGDEIKGFDSVENFISFVNQNKGKEISLEMVSGGKENKLKIIPRENPPKGEGSLGVGLSMGGFEKVGFFRAIYEALKSAIMFFGLIFVMLFKLIISIFGGGDLFKYVSGPVGIFKATAQATNLGLPYLANLVALISLNLAAVNIFPFPALDGGRIVFLIAEKIKGSPISQKVQVISNGVGFILLIILLLLISLQDVFKYF